MAVPGATTLRRLRSHPRFATTAVLMKLYRVILTILLAAGCEKSSNVAPMQDEVTGMTNHYKQRFDDLSKRIATLEARGRSMVSIGTLNHSLGV